MSARLEASSSCFSTFKALHADQLRHFEVPENLWVQLDEKLRHGSYDIDELAWDDAENCVKSNRDISDLSTIWLIRHTISATSSHKLLDQLQNDFPLLLSIADDIQALEESDNGSCSDHQQDDDFCITAQVHEDTSVIDDASGQPHDEPTFQDVVFNAVRHQLHRHVFMFEAHGCGRDGGNIRVRYMLDAKLTRMPVAAEPHINICPFMYFAAAGSREPTLLSIAWPVQPLVCGQPLTRCRLPLGLADYARKEFWAESYRCETTTEEWYCDLTSELWDLVMKHAPKRRCKPSRPAVHITVDCTASPDSMRAQTISSQLDEHNITNNQISRPAQDIQTAVIAGLHDPPLHQHISHETQGCDDSAAAAYGPSQLTSKVLVAGCGNSTLGVDLLKKGLGNIINVDYIQEVVDMMSKRYPTESYPGLSWVQADLTDWRKATGNEYDMIIDKATLDAMLTSDAANKQRWLTAGPANTAAHGDDSSNVLRYLREMWRVIKKPHGRFIVISLRPYTALQRLLDVPFNCAVSAGSPNETTGVPISSSAWGWQAIEKLDVAEAHAYVCAPIGDSVNQ